MKFKMDKRSELAILKRRNKTDGQQVYEQMSLTIREMQIKTTMKCHLIPGAMATTRKKQEATEKRQLFYSVDGNVN
jgi:hypothetical protein